MSFDLIRGTSKMVAAMNPELQDGTFVFVCVGPDYYDDCRAHAVGSFREKEGVSFILPVETARGLGLPTNTPMRCISLGVYSALDGVGLTAVVATALAESGIACNMVSAYHHDHVFVPEGRAQEATVILQTLQSKQCK